MSAREMLLADIVDPWLWAYQGHGIPISNLIGEPLWRSNAPEWHGLRTIAELHHNRLAARLFERYF